MKKLSYLLFFLSTFKLYSQGLVVINGGSPSPSNHINAASNHVTTVNFTVSGVQSGMELREVCLKFGNGISSYSASLERVSVTLTDGATSIELIRDKDFGESGVSDRKIANFKLRDHNYLQYFSVHKSIITDGQPFYHGYYRSRGNFYILKKGN